MNFPKAFNQSTGGKAVALLLVTSLATLAVFPLTAFAAPTVVSFTTVETTSWTAPAGVTSVEYLVVGGGGGGGARGGGGGGAGGLQTGTLSVTPGASYSVVVGAGGAGGILGTQHGQNGASSTFASITSKGGGGGANFDSGATPGFSGGSGGGAWAAAGGNGTAGQGNNGGTGTFGSSYGASGGGGAGAAGSPNSGTTPGNGGAGTASSITGASVTYAGGGGGGGELACSTGGIGGGGNGTCGNPGTTGGAGTNGRGGGGGGGSAFSSASGGAGGSGIVVISYTAPSITITQNSTITGGASVIGTLSKGSGSFVIDHPLDPRNKLLYHSFVESPDVKNVYDGIAILDKNGEAVIELPRYFLALNKDFRYLATAIGQPMPDLHLGKEVHRYFFGLFGKIVFKISGGAAGGKVSWQITGVRQDPLILAHPIITEVEKGPDQLVNKGEFICPECYAK